jgi:hypothetical protein
MRNMILTTLPHDLETLLKIQQHTIIPPLKEVRLSPKEEEYPSYLIQLPNNSQITQINLTLILMVLIHDTLRYLRKSNQLKTLIKT